MRTPLPVLQGVIDLRPAVAFDPFSQRSVADATGARALPELEPLLQRGPQSFADDVLAVAARIEPILEVSLEVCPTELAATVSQVISGLSVGHDHSGAGQVQEFGGDGGGSCETDHEVRERGGDERPNPRLRCSLYTTAGTRPTVTRILGDKGGNSHS